MFEGNFLKVTVGLIVGLAAIMYFQPPHTPCEAQVEVYGDSIKNLGKPFSKALANCKEHPDTGGCLSYFEVLGKIEAKYTEVSQSCQIDLAKDDKTRNWMNTTLELLARVAWGSVPPMSYLYRNGWLDFNQVVEFCRVRHHFEAIYGSEAWNAFALNILEDLPGASNIIQQSGEAEAWNRSLLSDSCQYNL